MFLAVLASVALTVGLYLMKRQAERLPSLGGGWRLRAWWAFVRNPWWVLGVALQAGGYGVYLVTLRTAPLSVVHTALNGGIALFVVLSVVGLGERVKPLEWLGVGTVTAGLIALGASFSDRSGETSAAHGTLAFALVLVALALLALLADPAPRRAVGLSVASGLVLGLASVYAKGLATTDSFAAAVRSTDLLLTLAANVIGFALMQGALQAGRGVVVVPIFSTLSNVVPMIGGIIVYGESLPGHGGAAVLRPLAFVLALLGAAVLAGLSEVQPARDAPVLQMEESRSR